MKTRTILILSFCIIFINLQKAKSEANPLTVELARQFSSDLFTSNGIPFLEPVVKVVNLTSNTGFFSNAFVPHKVAKPYFHFSIEGMVGFVPDKYKTYTPSIPSVPYNTNDLSKYISITPGGINIDTIGLIHYFFLNLIYDGVSGNHKGMIKLPPSSVTALGSQSAFLELRHSALDSLVKAHPLYSLLDTYGLSGLKDSISNIINHFPERFTLPTGGDVNTILAGVPQIIIGSFWGTELLLRYVPKINLGSTIGNFSFWGAGLKHSITQYFPKSPIDAALQIVYQGTSLDNTIGVTNAKLKANADIMNINLHISKEIPKILTIYTGISYESIQIKSTYTYTLPVEIQYQLGLLESPHREPTPGFPGDQNPQIAKVNVSNNHFKYTIGLARAFGPILISGSCNITDMVLLGFSIGYNF
ncbi:MAG TPA: hypothetical protein PLC04_02360 [Candidatus Kapabacteria bacterium]|jgi:hypothetical protein|nr:hypothetical protein [Candidatus Kapabacteria bacterium]HOV91910.1 hypothetical protein [Candidatus Kapabacteria bacterium]